jgi:hypothetical protein
MRPSTFAEPEFTPVFDWSPRRGRKLSLISFITASAVVHALCFYVFQVIYPPTVALLPPPARVTVITPNSDEGRLLLRWIEAEDPALSSTTQRPPEAPALAPPKPAHVPSYAGRVPPLKEVPPSQPDLRVPSAQPPGPVPIPRAAIQPTAQVVPTTLTFGEEAGQLGRPEMPPLQFITTNVAPPHVAHFRVGISHLGQVQYCLLETSSGDARLDEQARSQIIRTRFPAANRQASAARDEVLWTTATIAWGNDIAVDGGRTPPRQAEPNR